MMSDLFSSFDYSWGGGGYILGFSVWFSTLLLPFFLVSYMVFWFGFSRVESFFMMSVEGFMNVLETQKVKMFSGSAHVFISLFFFLLCMNLGGVFPFSYALTFHFVVTLSFAFPFWLMTLMLHMNINWRLFWVAHVQEGSSLLATLMIIFAEWVSVMIRPITLAVRMSMNVFVGQLIMKLISSMGVGLMYPFSWLSGYKSGIYVFSSVCWAFITAVFFLVELCVGFLQTAIFISLLVFYIHEVSLKAD
uniref:ATP synthase subunit a n=1 Tax=Arctica islandica TaxID=59239 RepID=T1QRC7_ARCIS|nr:ATP synthase F0 subunit 6 [Arctica islandica]AGC84103.1 ATP synthase F0 subunit 6 [Arctica islandica]AGW53602.1 ATP synthase F0 subunit 6 [Arctica islandica]AGW53614.1 ATP synthase F0 subunit 6 [Arctica islandica]